MKKICLILTMVGVLISLYAITATNSLAEDNESEQEANSATVDSSKATNFLGVPLIQDAQIISRNNDRIQMIVPLNHDQIVEIYRDLLKDEKDIKFRLWNDSTYIEDDSNRPWHSVTINKEYKDGTLIQIDRDKWSWIIGTLILRFIGVLLVLFVLYLFLAITGKIISRTISRIETGKT